MQKKSWSLILSAMLAIGLAGCGDDKSEPNDPQPGEITQPETKPCSGDECNTKQKEAEEKMASCDFAQAYEALDAVYAAQVKDNKVDAQTAFDRSLLGLIHILYRKDVQAILPKLGFIAKSGVVDFKPIWEGDKGLFKQAFTTNHDYEDFSKRIPMTIFQNNSEDEEDEIAWIDTIDKKVTADDILDVLVSLKPELESLAKSLEEAAKLTGSTAISPSEKIGCGLNNFKVDAADLNAFAAMLMAADAAIDMFSHYDFNFSIYEYASNIPEEDESAHVIPECYVRLDANDNVLEDRCKDYFGLDYKELECSEPFNIGDNEKELFCTPKDDTNDEEKRQYCTVNLDTSGNVTSDECKDDYSLDYKTLFCAKHELDETPYIECFVPNKSEAYKKAETVANLLIPHLFRATQSQRKSAGSDGETAFKKAGEYFKSAIDGDAKGAFFDFSKLPEGARKDMLDIAKEMASGNGDLSKFIKPNLKVDLKKVFNDVLYAKDGDIQIDVTENNVETSGNDWIGNFFAGIYGDEIFLNEKLPNYIFNTDLISHDTYYGEGIDYIEIEFYVDDKYDATFSSDWDKLVIGSWLNPHEYFGISCEDGDWCEEKCPDESKRYYHKDDSSPEGFICTGCWDKCGGKNPYCVENILDHTSYCIDKPECAEGEQPIAIEKYDNGTYEVSIGCAKIEGYRSSEYCEDDNGEYPNGRYVFYDDKTKKYVCEKCPEKCGSDRPYCLALDPNYENSDYICATVESCPADHTLTSNGLCMPPEGTPCPDELKTKDICHSTDPEYKKDAELYYCDSEGIVRIEYDYMATCKTIDVSAYTSERESISVLESEYAEKCTEEYLATECVDTPDSKPALSARGCVKATDGSLVNVNFIYRGIYTEVCNAGEICDYSSELSKYACLDPNPKEPEPEEP
ncbi:MAG: hypothetical protein IJU23_13435 [Proteobacteria bacterium]|nr:hypothetical protein [Pseudomonadota bacterium]